MRVVGRGLQNEQLLLGATRSRVATCHPQWRLGLLLLRDVTHSAWPAQPLTAHVDHLV